MLGTGAGSYIHDLNAEGKIDDKHDGSIKFLVVETVLQPHTPQEHDIFEAIVKEHDDDELTLEGGALKVRLKIPVPELEAVVKENGHAGVALKSDMDAKRAEEAAKAQEAKKALEQAQADTAEAAAQSQQLRNDELAEVAAKAGAAAAAEVLKNAAK